MAPESDSEIEAGVCSVKALHEIMLPATNLNQLKMKFSDKIQNSWLGGKIVSKDNGPTPVKA